MRNKPASDFAVLLMAHGGPQQLSDIPAFLAHIRYGRPISPAFLEEVTERYKLIGGSSPLGPICERLTQKLGQKISAPVYLGMRHCHPFIDETLKKIAAEGHSRVVAICLAPHFSSLSILQYEKALVMANGSLKEPLEVNFVKSWNVQKGLIDFHTQQILKALQKLKREDLAATRIMFTAHSLPSRILQTGDTYVDELNQTMDAVMSQVAAMSNPSMTEKPEPRMRREHPHASFAFQSASPSPEPWLGPNVKEVLELFAASGVKNVVLVPIGFVAEHVEVLFDLDIEAKSQANSLGIDLLRADMLNDREEMVAILQDIVEESSSKFQESMVIKLTERYLA